MDKNLTKAQRRQLRELGGIAYERDLSAHLAALESEFKRWRTQEIDAFELSDAVHRFHQGPARDLFSTYQPSNLDFAVAHAIHRGVLSEQEAGAQALEVLAKHLSYLREREPE
jgi:hypothetical protein